MLDALCSHFVVKLQYHFLTIHSSPVVLQLDHNFDLKDVSMALVEPSPVLVGVCIYLQLFDFSMCN